MAGTLVTTDVQESSALLFGSAFSFCKGLIRDERDSVPNNYLHSSSVLYECARTHRFRDTRLKTQPNKIQE